VGKYTIQISADDGCIYIYDVDTHLLRKVCEVAQMGDVPEIVKETLRKAHLDITLKS
jgi:hypothetical protein